MYKRFFSYAGIEGLSKGINWLTIALLPLFLPTSEYGIVGLLVAGEGVMNTILTLGQPRAILRHTITFKEKTMSYALHLNILSVIIVFFVGLIIAIFKHDLWGISIFPHLFALFISLLFFNFSNLICTYALATDNPRFFRNARLWYAIVKLVAVMLICFLTRKGISYIYGSLIAGLTFMVMFYRQIYNHLEIKKLLVFDKNLKFLFLFGLPLIFHTLSGSILSYADRFFVEEFLNKSQLGIYTFVYSLGSSIFFFYGSVAAYFEPLVYRYSAEKTRYQAILKFYLTSVLSCAFLFCILILVGSRFYAFKFISEEYISGFHILPVILGAYLIIPFYHLGNYELTVLNKTGFVAVSTISSAILNIALNFLFISTWGLWGAAFSTLLSYIFLSLICNGWAMKISGTDNSYLKYITLLFAFVILIITYINYNISQIWTVTVVLFFASLIFGLLSIKQLPKLKSVVSRAQGYKNFN